MIISNKHKFIFIHIPKTAGLSIAKALSAFDETPPRTMKNRMLRRLSLGSSSTAAYLKQHDTARRIARLITPADYSGFFRFAVVRNPFDHAVSHYEYMKQHPSRYSVVAQSLDFESFLAYRSSRPWYVTESTARDQWFTRLPAQNHFVTGSDGALKIDRFIRLERLDANLPDVLADLGIPDVSVPTVNRSRFRSRDRRLADWYSPRSIDLIHQIYERDFELFGYDSDPSALL